MKMIVYLILLILVPAYAQAQSAIQTENASNSPDNQIHANNESIDNTVASPDAINDKQADQKDRTQPETCTYDAYAWDTRKKRSTDHFHVEKPYSEVTDEERDPNAPDCTICIEDQVTIHPKDFGVNLGSIRICHRFAPQVKQALTEIAQSKQFDIIQLEGYRPGKTRGKIDANGLRTQWSQHSYGTAIDINANRNAIYSNCTNKIVNSSNDVKDCKKGIGGAYQPEKQPRVSIVKDGVVYNRMTQFWKWGGEIDGTTKDIMHFSITGY